MNRRGFLAGLASALVAPAVVRAASLMRISPPTLVTASIDSFGYDAVTRSTGVNMNYHVQALSAEQMIMQVDAMLKGLWEPYRLQPTFYIEPPPRLFMPAILRAFQPPEPKHGPLVAFDAVPALMQQRICIDLLPHPTIGTPCWCWTHRLNRNGYGRIAWEGKEPVAHRLLWELTVGDIPAGHILDHLCARRICVNPHHLEPVTHQINTHRGAAILFKVANDQAQQS